MIRKLENLLQAEVDPAFSQRARFILQIIAKEKPKRILDAGCGRGFYINALTFFSFPEEIFGVDIQKKYINQAKKNIHDPRVHLQAGTVDNMPFKDNFFDAIICSEVFEHLPDERKALSEIRRVLKKNGSLIITVPNERFPFLWDPLNWFLMRFFQTHVNKDTWWLAGIWAGHLRLYTKESLKHILTGEQLRIIVVKEYLSVCWPFSHFLLYGVGKNLVERMNLKSFSRFRKEPTALARIAALIFGLPSFMRKNTTGKAAVGLVAHVKKV